MKKSLWAFCLLGSQMMISQVHFRLAPFYGDAIYSPEGKLEYMSLLPEKSPRAGDVAAFINNNVLNDGPSKVAVLRTEKDDLGFTHTRYNLTYNGVVVSGRQIIAHVKDGKLVSLNGDLAEVAKPENSISLTEKAALASALHKVNARLYKWEDAAEVAMMRETIGDPNFSYDPVGSHEILEKDGKAYYTWKFNIYASEPLYRAHVFVDAASGTVLEEQNLICTSDVPGTAVTKYSGTQSFTVDMVNSNLYRLRETGRGQGIETYNMKNGTTYGAATDFTNTTTTWSGVINDQGARDAHWGAEKTYDYLKTQHNRNSIDNNGFKLKSYVHYSNNYTNAFWDGQRMSYGDGNGGGMKIFTTLDICGHEIAHGLTSNTGGLIYQNESGALNESWSDIFGACIENYGRPTNWNWKIGEDMTFGGLRDMSNPNLDGSPDTYNGTNWYVGTWDNGGVHTNSGVGNFWFYLLTMGGSGTNDISNAYNVSGIGFTDAGKIAYRSLTTYFTPNTTYMNARNLSIQAAKDLFGTCSNQVTQTQNAWYAVGLGTPFNPNVVGAGFLANNSNYCNFPATVTFTNLTTNGGIYLWNFGDGSTSTATNPVKTYTAPGQYTVRLKATGCNNLTDSTKLNSLITINVPSAPLVSNVSHCSSYPATLTAQGSGNINWYPNVMSSQEIATGSSYITPILNNSTTYYVSNTSTSTPATGGLTAMTNGGYLNNNVHWLSFDVYQNCTIKTVEVDAYNAGLRIFQVKNATGGIVQTVQQNLVAGLNTVTLNITLSPGLGYRIGLSSASTSFMYRTNSGVNFPYMLGNTLKITGSSQAGNYFWFYNWNVAKTECSSPKVPLTVNVMPTPTVSALAASSAACEGDDGIELTGEPSGGSFTGPGVSGAYFIPSAAGSGTHKIYYTYTDGNGCSATDSTMMLTIDMCTGLKSADGRGAISVFPNPARDFVTISTAGAAAADVFVYDATGRIVFRKNVTGDVQVPLAGLANGLYVIRMTDARGNDLAATRFIKE